MAEVDAGIGLLERMTRSRASGGEGAIEIECDFGTVVDSDQVMGAGCEGLVAGNVDGAPGGVNRKAGSP